MVVIYPMNFRILIVSLGYVGECPCLSENQGGVGTRLATYSQVIHENKKLSVLYLQVFYEFEILSRKIIKQLQNYLIKY